MLSSATFFCSYLKIEFASKYVFLSVITKSLNQKCNILTGTRTFKLHWNDLVTWCNLVTFSRMNTSAFANVLHTRRSIISRTPLLHNRWQHNGAPSERKIEKQGKTENLQDSVFRRSKTVQFVSQNDLSTFVINDAALRDSPSIFNPTRELSDWYVRLEYWVGVCEFQSTRTKLHDFSKIEFFL